jgi:hypothetical protein
LVGNSFQQSSPWWHAPCSDLKFYPQLSQKYDLIAPTEATENIGIPCIVFKIISRWLFTNSYQNCLYPVIYAFPSLIPRLNQRASHTIPHLVRPSVSTILISLY